MPSLSPQSGSTSPGPLPPAPPPPPVDAISHPSSARSAVLLSCRAQNPSRRHGLRPCCCSVVKGGVAQRSLASVPRHSPLPLTIHHSPFTIHRSVPPVRLVPPSALSLQRVCPPRAVAKSTGLVVLPAHQRRVRLLLSSATAILWPRRGLSRSSLTISIITNWPRRSFSPLICQRPGLTRNCRHRFMLKPTVPPLDLPLETVHQSQSTAPTLPSTSRLVASRRLPRPFTRRRPSIDRLTSTPAPKRSTGAHGAVSLLLSSSVPLASLPGRTSSVNPDLQATRAMVTE